MNINNWKNKLYILGLIQYQDAVLPVKEFPSQIHGLEQERRNSGSYVFLILTHQNIRQFQLFHDENPNTQKDNLDTETKSSFLVPYIMIWTGMTLW